MEREKVPQKAHQLQNREKIKHKVTGLDMFVCVLGK